MPQGWNKGTKRDVEPKQIKNLVFRKDKKTKEDSARDDMDNLNLKNQFDPRKPQDRQLTNERVSSLINGIIQNIPSACVLCSSRVHSTTLSKRVSNDSRSSEKGGN